MKLRNLMGAVLALAGIAFGGTAFADGSIWDIVGESLTKPADDPYRASETIRFRMRLVSPTYDQPEADREVWSVQLNPEGPYAYCIGNPSLIAMVEAMAPLKLGIVARGVSRSSLTERVAGAVLEGMAKPSAQKQLTELTFVYTTRCGDFALPLRAAADGEGHALGDASAGEKYYFLNGPGDTGNEVWSIVTTAGTAFVPTASGVAKAEIDCDPVRQDAATGADFLRKLDYNIVTMDFDSREAVVDDKPYWRAVNEGSKSSKVTESGALVVGEPRICTYDETTSPASADLRLYAWVAPGDGTDGDPSSWTWGDEAGYAVRIAPGTSARTQTFEDPDGVSRAHTVYEFAIVSNRVFYGFELEGQHRGKAARVVLSRTPQYNWVGDSGSSGVKTLLVDFLAEPVLCIEPEAPTISVTIDGYGNPAEFDCAFDKYTQGHALQVRLNTPNPSNDAMKVQLKFALGDEEGFPTNIIAVSEDSAGGFSKNPLAGMEVSIPPGAYFPEKPVYLFVLGAKGETAVPPGITVTPVPEGRFASFIETTNSQYVVIRGMEPVVVKPSGTQESPAAAVTVSCGTPHLFAITIDDSYRNLHLLDGTNGFYTVTWERGIGKTLTITNDINGQPLVPDAYGRLNIGVTYPVSSTTNQYLSSFSVRNPEGLSSADSYITVKTRDPDYVVAETLDGSTEAMESDDEAKFVNLRFRLVPDAAGAVDYDKLYAFLEPLNAAASNCTSASFLTTAASGKSRGVKLVEGVGTTDSNEDEDESEPTGGLQILDGDGKSTARFNVVLCTAKAWDSGKRVGQYASKSFSLKLLNFKPAVSQVKITDVRPGEGGATTEKNYYVVAGGTNSTPIQTGHDIKLAVRRPGQDWNGDVAADLFATTNRQVVLRWVVYEVGEDGATSDPYAYGWEVGTNSVFELDEGFDDEGIKKIVVRVQDKDMRDARCVVEESGKWKYYMDPDDHDYQEWQMDENGWGDEFTFYIRISDQPTIDLLPVGNVDEYRSQPLFSEGQLAPFSVYDKDLASKYDAEAGNVGFKVMLSDKYNSQDKLTLVAWVEGPTNSVQLAVTNVVGFKNARQTTAKVDFPIAAFDGTYASQGVPDKYTVKARVVKAGSDTGTEATNHYVIGSCDFYVRNEAPLVFLTDRKQLASDGSSSNDTIRVVKNQHITVPWRVEDVGYDLTNATKGVTVTCTTSSGGTIVGSATTNVVGAAGAISGSFEVYFSSAGSNWVLIEAKDKDEDIGEARTCFEVEANKNVFVYPTRPFNSSLGSDVISDYLRSPGYGYVWANGTLGGIENFMQTWTYGIASGSAIVYASGYTAGEKETVAKAASKNKAFVDANGGNVEDDTRAYVCPLSGLDSFFYRWIVKSISEGGGSGGEEGEWSAKVPDPQISTNAADRVKQYTVDLPREQKDGVFADAAVMAVFAREYLWSDNLGDINQDGVPDVYVLQYKLTDGNYDAGADMKDVNFGTDGKTPYCQDYLPLTEFVRYSKLIPELTEYANIENAQAFTPRKKLRGYDDNLNDATAEYFPDGVRNQAFVDGAAPERRYEMEDGSWSAASCTVSYVEHLAWKAFEATHPGATFADWSPERPTDPTKADTDNDGFTDGYEYYWWYRAHVGYLAVDANGTEALRKATGRAYDPRNPGEGRFISTEEIERTFDPLTPLADITQDTDLDGLPDLLEFEIGTNPIDFDTDGDGLPDGFEIMISGTDPLKAYTTPGITDGMRNFDGDAMAFTTPKLEEQVLPKPLNIEVPFSFALVEAGGDTDGVQWYVSKTMPTNVVVGQTCVTGTVVTAADKTFVTSAKVPVYRDGDELRLAADLPKATTWEVVALESLTNTITCLTNLIEVVETEVTDEESGETVTRLLTNKTDYVAFMPTRIAAGSVVTTNAATFATLEFGGEGVKGVNAAWVYGSKTLPTQTTGDNLANQGGYGMLAVGRYKDAPAQKQLAALPAPDENVAYLHYLVYQEFGFDPRTAWNANTPLAARWGTTVGEGENKEVKGNNYAGNFGYAGIATRTREYTTYDEFLVFSFFLNNGMTVLTYEDLGDRAPSMAELWYANTTNPQGPTEAVNTTGAATDGGTGEGGDSAASEYWGRNDTNGADTDGDGVPDGWELYVMAGPKNPKTGEYVFAMPYLDGYRSSFGPFVPDAASATKTDNSATSGYDSAAGDGDGLTELQEFAGTDSCAWYAQPQGARTEPFSTTIARPEEHRFWLNKFFPTDPWEKDTDGDSLSDSGEFGKFRYGSDPVDTGKTSIPGGGLNPCAVDTDLDGLPDPWEAQYAGKTIYTGEGAQYAKGTAADGSEVTSSSVTLQGLCDGMDGTVFDAYNSVYVNRTTGTSDATDSKTEVVSVGGVAQVVDRDYDRDGLENWQEYLVGAMRCWRYDDPFSDFGYIASDLYFDPLGNFSPNYKALGIETEGRSQKDVSDEFWYETLFNKTGRIYNPHLVTDQSSGAQYFTRVRNGFDPAFREAGTYYLFYDRAGWNPDGTPTMLGDLWGVQGYGLLSGPAPKKYISCDPTKSDTDQDGMDDYYELFHGMNPLLGADNTRATSHGGCDIVYDAWYDVNFGSYKYPNGDQVNGAPCRALANLWIAKGGQRTGFDENHMDFVRFPWLNGLETADPDGDDIRNQAESIMAKVAPTSVFLHTDPTPLWMTDSSYTNSLVYRFFRLPTNFSTVFVPESIRHGEEVIPLYTCDGYMMTMFGPVLAPFLPDYWQVAAEETQNWIASFEENEGYDSDHDALSDQEEFKGNLRGASDPQDFDSPHRRQAMYFPGKDAALQSMPFVAEDHPRYAVGYPDDMSFLQYTVECWVRPESAADATVIERGVWTSWSNPGDQELLRKNFQVAVKNGKWYTKFDSGTLAGGCVEVQGQADVEIGKWTHVAATYDAQKLTLYVNGVEAGKKGFEGKGLIPEYGSSAVVVHPGEGTFSTNGFWGGRANGYWFDKEYSLHAFLIGASFKGIQDLGGVHTSHLNVLNGAGWNRYKDFFKGYVDEVRVWDGARSSLDIKADMKVRYTAALAKANRDDFYDQWAAGRRRYDKDGNAKDFEVIPELRYHWSFDSVPGAANAEMAAKVPLGYAAGGVKAPLSRPDDWTIGWWSTVLAGYGSVYSDPTWVTWVPNTVTHLPRFDGTTLDSFYWSDDFMGDTAEKNNFARTAEPVSRWTQYVRNGLSGATTSDGVGVDFESTGRRFWLANVRGTNEVSNLATLFEFTGRHLNQQGDDLLPLGGAFAKYCDDMWDENGPSMPWEVTGDDGNGNGLPDWWEEYAKENYLLDPVDADNMKWTTLVDYNGRTMTAGQAYLYDLNRGLYADRNGNIKTSDQTYAQKADEDKDGMPDWWEEMNGLHNGMTDLTAGGHADGDPDNDGLSNYQEYLASAVYGFYDLLNPVSARSGVMDQKVTDYFLPITNDFPWTFNGRTLEEPRNFMRGEYLGAVLTDHDFMENWWENKYAKNYTSAWIYDPWDDTDGDGWSNFAECRAFMWGGAVASDIIDRWLDGNVTEAANHLLDYPRPAIGVKITYASDQINDIDGKGLVVRTKTTGKRVDATFVIHGTDAETIEAQDHIIGSFYDRVTIHGFLNPGWLLENDVKLFMAQISAADLYTWRVYKTYEAYKNNSLDPDDYWEYSGTYADYRASKRSHQWVRLISPEIDWGDPIAMVHSDKDAHFGELLYTGEEGSSATIGTVDFYTGEYTLDLNKLRSIDSKAENSIFKFAYSYKIGKNWPQTLWLSDTFDDAGAEDERTGNFVNGSGRVREGLNTIEAFIDYNNNGRWDAGEPYGMVKDVPVGWHKVPEITLELTDEAKVVPRMLVTADSGDEANDKDGEGGATTATRVRIVRESINGQTDFGGLKMKERTVMAKEFVMDDRAYLTEADVLTAKKPDLDWQYLRRDAAKYGIASIDYVTYRIESYSEMPDGSISNTVIGAFTHEFNAVRPSASAVAPIAGSPVYTAAPTFWFTTGEDAAAFEIQVADENGTVIYDSGVKMLGGRASVTVGSYAYKFTAPIYADASIVTNGAPVLVDGKTYKWRVVAFNAKFNDAFESDYSDWTPFQMDVGNVNRYPVSQTTGYGKVGAVVRYFGPAKTNDLTNLIVVEAFGNADFTGQALAQARLSSTNELSDVLAPIDTIACTNAVLGGLDIGVVYLRAYIDLNNNGKWDKFEPWGYANMVGEYGTDYSYPPIYNPKGMKVGASAADLKKPDFTTIFIEDTDWNKNEIPDCLEDIWDPTVWPLPPVDPETAFEIEDSDGGGAPDDWEEGAGTDPADPEDEQSALVATDVMAYEDIENVLLARIGTGDFDAAWYAVMDLDGEGMKLRDSDIPLQTDASTIKSLFTTWNMIGFSPVVQGIEPYVGIGRPVTFEPGEAKVLKTAYTTVRLVHAQVYAKNGFETGCAAICPNGGNDPRLVDGISAAEHPHTKPFTVLDKYLVCRYLENIGVEGVSESNMLAQVRAAKALQPDAETWDVWRSFTLDPNEVDGDHDGIADGWELYTMFGKTGLKAFTGANLGTLAAAKIRPFNAADGLALAPGAGSRLKLAEEFDGGYYPTDPWSVDTDRDGVIDWYAYQYHLKGGDAGKDFDLDEDGNWVGDGLPNLVEYYITEVFKCGHCDPDKVKTDGACVDYFQKMGDLYVGEIFTDHDQIDDVWEGGYEKAANRYAYDPDRDDDNDGWSNYAEFRAGTDPTKLTALGVSGANDTTTYTKNEYPIPTIEAKVIYNGSDVNLGKIVFKAWNDADDPDMTSAPDAIWTIGNGEAAGKEESGALGPSTETGSTAVTPRKYIGRKPSGVQTYQLSGGSIASGSITVQFLDQQFVRYDSNDVAVARNATSPKDANWYAGVWDKNGKLYDYRDREVGSVDYATGLLTLDCGKLTGSALGLPNSTDGDTAKLVADKKTAGNTGGQYYDTISLDNSSLLVSWSAVNIKLTAEGTYYLADADAVSATAKSHGHVREGRNTFICYMADSDGAYVPGAPFGVVRGVDVGWQGAKFTVELTETSPIADRIRLADNADDRKATIQGTLAAFINDRMLWAIPEVLKTTNDAERAELIALYSDAISNRVQTTKVGEGMKSRIRVVRYGIDDWFCYSAGVYDSGLGMGYDQRVVMEKEFDMNSRDFVNEADFLDANAFDIDWGTMTDEIVDENGVAIKGVKDAALKVTNMTYLVVVGDGAKDFRGSDDTNATVYVAGVISRRFELTRHVPKIVSPTTGAYVYGARPTFRWAIPDEEPWAARFGSTYTAFRIQISKANGGSVYDSGIRRAPAQTEKGVFEWTAEAFAGDQLPVGSYTWKVSMYNAKFRSDAWSLAGSFSIATGTQQETDDHNYSSIDVSVKYTGPALVLNEAGFVRVQAFETADFSGTPVAQTRITDIASVRDAADIRKNGTLIGLPFGTYYVRAYIDTNKNGVKDAWESWGCAKEPVTLTTDQLAPIVGLYIEDADTDQDWLPDAWEYAKYGNLSKKGAEIDPEGRIVLKQVVYDDLAKGQANISKFLSGASLTFFQNIGNVSLALGLDAVTEKSIAEIRAMVEKNIDPTSVKITSLTVDPGNGTNGKVWLTVAAKATDSIAGYLLEPLYEIPKSTIVTINIYRKANLATDEWKLEKTVTSDPIVSTMEQRIPVPIEDVDFNSGFYKVEIVQ